MTDPPRLLLVHGVPTMRAGLHRLLTDGGFDVAVAGSAEDALEAAVASAPQLVMVAAELPGGMALVRTVGERLRGARTVVITERADGEELLAAVLAGARGYLRADMQLERLPAAVHGVLAGEVALPRAQLVHLLEELRARHASRTLLSDRTGARLSAREWEVLSLLARDASTAVIAHELGISEVTVRRHVSAVVSKLGVRDRGEAVELMRRSSS